MGKYRLIERTPAPALEEEGEIAKKLGGHGGMDYIMLYRLLQCMLEGLAPDMDVYDAAAWSAPGPVGMPFAGGRQRLRGQNFPTSRITRWRERACLRK